MQSQLLYHALNVGGFLLTVGLIGAGVLFALAPHPPKAPAAIATLDELDSYLTELTASGDPPSLSVTVVKRDKIVYSRAFGLADGPGQVAATPNTVYHWWSMTKIVTAIAVLQLSERGQLDLDAPITDYLPWFAVQYPAGNSQAVTVRHLLEHSSGLPDAMPAMIGWVHYADDILDQTALVKQHLPQYKQLKFGPGTHSAYTNLGYMVLGAVVEAVSGQPYADYVAGNILHPLGMLRTSFLYLPAQQDHEAKGSQPLVHPFTPLLPFLLDSNALVERREGNILWLNRVYIDALPPSGLIGPASDVARLLQAFLNGGELDGARVLSPQSVAMMTAVPEPLATAQSIAELSGSQHGLGWYVVADQGRLRLQHDGSGPGFATTMRIYPEHEVAIAILANGTDLDRDGLSELVVRTVATSEGTPTGQHSLR